MKFSGAQIVKMLLEEEGTEVIFGMPGGHNLELFDAFKDASFETVLTTSELTAAFMADSYGRVTGKIGVCVSSPGPGFTYLLPGIAEAFLDSSPVIAIVATLQTDIEEYFQIHEIDQQAIASPMVKRFFSVKRFGEIAPCMFKAFSLAKEEEPGPVMIEIPVNILRKRGIKPFYKKASEEKTLEDQEKSKLAMAAQLMVDGKSSGIYAGRGAFIASDEIKLLCEHLSLPLCTTVSGRGIISEDHPLSLGFGFSASGTPFARKVMSSCDTLLAVGCKFSDVATGGWEMAVPEKLIHVDANPANLNKNCRADIAITMDAQVAAKGIVDFITSNKVPQRENRALKELIRKEKEAYYSLSPGSLSERSVTPPTFFLKLREKLERDAVLVTDCGMHQFWALSHFQVFKKMTFISPVDFQSMGFCIPASIAAKKAFPDRKVVGICGDGGFLMTGFELLTAARENLNPKIFVFNDGGLGLIEKLQQKVFLKTHAVTLQNPDYQYLARSFGINYMKIQNDLEIDSCLDKIVYSDRPSLVEVKVVYNQLPHYIDARLKAGAKKLPLNQKISFASRIIYRKVRHSIKLS